MGVDFLTAYLDQLGFDPLPYMTYIPDYMYSNCDWLKHVGIHDGIDEIGGGAFDFCGYLSEVNISDTLTRIGAWAFHKCKSLRNINYKGTKEQFAEIDKGYDCWLGIPHDIVIHCKDGDIKL